MAGRNTFSSTSSGATGIRAPHSIPGGELAGAELVRELPGEVALPAWQTLRSVLTWAAAAPGSRRALFDPAAMEAWEVELLRAEWEPELRLPLAVLVGGLVEPEDVSPERMARACLAVADWALEHAAVSTALAYAEAAAHSWPENPRYAYTCGRLLRTHGRTREAEGWMRRSIQAAVRAEDVDAQTLGQNSLGNLLHKQGKSREALRVLTGALRLARRYRLRDREGEVLHDLFVVETWRGDLGRAERYARDAFDIYREGHARLPALAHDVANYWIREGFFTRAFAVLKELPPYFSFPGERLRVLGSLTRAAAACADEPRFRSAWNEAWSLSEDPLTLNYAAAALLEMGLGASSLQAWELAENALLRAVELADDTQEMDIRVFAEKALLTVRERTIAEHGRRTLDGRDPSVADALAAGFLSSLDAFESVAVA